MGENRRTLGGRYESAVADYLQARGWQLLEKNYRCPRGEIDLILRDGSYLVFVEVKYRRDSRMGAAAEAVNGPKQQRIRRSAGYYLYTHHYPEDTPCRFDVAAITGSQLCIIENAFE